MCFKYSVCLSRWKEQIRDFAYLSDVSGLNEPNSPVADVAPSEFSQAKKCSLVCSR